jgi:hypothetical protein
MRPFNRYLISLISFLVFLSLYTPIYSATRPILKIKGNKRSQKSYIQNLVYYCLENQSNSSLEINLPELKKCVLNSRHFSSVTLKITSEGLVVDVVDRWTLIPIPIVSTGSSGAAKYGLLVMDSNFLGYGKMVIAGGTVSSAGNTAIFMYQDKSLFFSNWTFGILLQQQESEIFSYKKEEKDDGLKEKRFTSQVTLGYKFSSILRIDLISGYYKKEYTPLEDYQLAKNYETSYGGFQVRWDQSNYKFFYQEGLKIFYKNIEELEKEENQERVLAAHQMVKINWQKPLWAGHILQLQLSAGQFKNATRSNAFYLGGGLGFRGVQEKGVWAEEFYAVSVDYQIPILSNQYGTWTIAPFYDQGSIELVLKEEVSKNYHSYGIGTYFYLNKVAIPGIGFIVGHNSKFETNFYKFTIGFSM